MTRYALAPEAKQSATLRSRLEHTLLVLWMPGYEYTSIATTCRLESGSVHSSRTMPAAVLHKDTMISSLTLPKHERTGTANAMVYALTTFGALC